MARPPFGGECGMMLVSTLSQPLRCQRQTLWPRLDFRKSLANQTPAKGNGRVDYGRDMHSDFQSREGGLGTHRNGRAARGTRHMEVTAGCGQLTLRLRVSAINTEMG